MPVEFDIHVGEADVQDFPEPVRTEDATAVQFLFSLERIGVTVHLSRLHGILSLSGATGASSRTSTSSELFHLCMAWLLGTLQHNDLG